MGPADDGYGMPRVLLQARDQAVNRAEDLYAVLQLVVGNGAKRDHGIDDVDTGPQVIFDARVHAYFEEYVHQIPNHAVRGELKVELDDILEQRKQPRQAPVLT